MEEDKVASEVTDVQNNTAKLDMKWLLLSVIFFIIFSTVFLCFRIVKVNGSSMLDTYKDGDYVIVNSIGYATSNKELERGSVVIVKPTGQLSENIIKRVIAVGGDEIFIDFESGMVSVNGETLSEPYTKEPTLTVRDFTYPLTVPDDCYFVMGDNRNDSIDSRSEYVGFVPKDNIMGEVMFSLKKIF